VEPAGLGISWLWKLPESHPFYKAGVIHDARYDDKLTPTSYEADREFLMNCLYLAKDNSALKVQAYFFYYLCRAWGSFRW
jgi:hypothetical protein